MIYIEVDPGNPLNLNHLSGAPVAVVRSKLADRGVVTGPCGARSRQSETFTINLCFNEILREQSRRAGGGGPLSFRFGVTSFSYSSSDQ